VTGNEADALAAHRGRHAPYGVDQVGGLREALELGAPLNSKESPYCLGSARVLMGVGRLFRSDHAY